MNDAFATGKLVVEDLNAGEMSLFNDYSAFLYDGHLGLHN
jgi:hypothetical protein